MNDQTLNDRFVAGVVDALPHHMPGLDNIVTELRSNIDERVGGGMSLNEALKQLGSPRELAERYAAALPLVASPLGRRFAAKMVDQGIQVAIMAVGLVTIFSVGDYGLFALAGLVLAMIAYTIYLVAAERVWGQTLGKRWFALQVVSESGLRITWIEALVRQLPIVLQIWPIDALFVLFNDKRQRAFEMVSKTRVVVAHQAPATARSMPVSRVVIV